MRKKFTINDWKITLKKYFPLEALADGFVQDHGNYKQAQKQAEHCLNDIFGIISRIIAKAKKEGRKVERERMAKEAIKV